ncbi:MAG: hypothetical protein ACKPKO_38350, partial [Candidatus Fonsibacter sp.]
FYGKLVPFGAKVVFKPSDTKSDSTTKVEPTSLTGVFAGYELASGYRSGGAAFMLCGRWTNLFTLIYL